MPSIRRLTVALLLAALAPASVADAALPASDEADNYRMNAGHTNARVGDTLAPPLVRRWSRALGGRVSNPLIAGDRVFVLAFASSATTLHALDRMSGATLWSRSVGTADAGLAYEDGRLFVLDDSSNQLRAFDAAGGETLWAITLTQQHAFREPPAVSDGIVYLGGAGVGGTLWAIAATSGATLWTGSTSNGAADSSPAVDGDQVYTTAGCAQTNAFDRLSGVHAWRYQTGCTGGGGATPVASDGRVFVQESGGHVLDAGTGTLLDSFSSSRPPAVGGGVAIYVSGSALVAESAAGGPTLWSFAGDGQIAEAPVIEGDRVFALSQSGNLYVLDRAAGALLWSGNVGSAAPMSWSEDISPTIGQGTLAVPAGNNLVAYTAAGPDTAVDGRPTSRATVGEFTLQLRASDPSATFECSVDDGNWQACSATQEVSGASPGDHWMEVRAVVGQERDPSPALVRWTQGGPVTTVTGRPAAVTASTTAEIAFSSSEPATIECDLDGSGWEACSSPTNLAGLADGNHAFQIRTTDQAGAVVSLRRVEWTVDTTTPDTGLSLRPPLLAADSSASFTLTSTSDPSSYECRSDNGDWEACSSVVALTGLADGTHIFEARATNAAGTADSTPVRYEWTVDTDAPGVWFTLVPPEIGTSREVAFAVAVGEAGAQSECSLDGSDWTACAGLSPARGLEDGTHRLRARARDLAGNVTRAPAEVSFVVDGTAPETRLSPAQASPNRLTSATFELRGSESDVRFECRFDGGDWSPCSASHSITSLSEGAHVIEARAIDRAGNVDPSPALYTWLIDRTPPRPAISDGPPTLTSARSATFAFGSDEAGVSHQCRLDEAAWSSCDETATYTELEDGSHTFHVRAVDQAGNQSDPAALSWVVDTVAPSTSIESGPPESTQDTAVVLRFGSDDPSARFECSTDGSEWAECSAEKQLEGLSPGTHELAVRAIDPAGNADPDPASVTWEVRPTRHAALEVPRRYAAARAAERGLPVTVVVPLHESRVELALHRERRRGDRWLTADRPLEQRVIAAASDGDNSLRLKVPSTARRQLPRRVRLTATIEDPDGERTVLTRVIRLRD